MLDDRNFQELGRPPEGQYTFSPLIKMCPSDKVIINWESMEAMVISEHRQLLSKHKIVDISTTMDTLNQMAKDAIVQGMNPHNN